MTFDFVDYSYRHYSFNREDSMLWGLMWNPWRADIPEVAKIDIKELGNCKRWIFKRYGISESNLIITPHDDSNKNWYNFRLKFDNESDEAEFIIRSS